MNRQTQIFILVALLLLAPGVFAKSITGIPNTPLQIVPQGFESYEAGESTFFFRVFNSTGFCQNDTLVDCEMTIYERNNIISKKNLTFLSPTDFKASFNLTPGHYTYNNYCNNSEAGYIADSFDILYGGEAVQESDNNLNITFFLILFVIVFGYAGHRFTSTSDDTVFNIGMIFFAAIGWVLTIISFLMISWSVSFAYYSVLKIVFLVCMILFGLLSTLGTLTLIIILFYQVFVEMFARRESK